jgi:hypothetical protein
MSAVDRLLFAILRRRGWLPAEQPPGRKPLPNLPPEARQDLQAADTLTEELSQRIRAAMRFLDDQRSTVVHDEGGQCG